MADPRIDRNAWAVVVRSLMDAEAEGNQTHFAAIVGVDRKTVARWLAGTVDVSEEKVRAVARSLSMSARELLVRVGYYQPEELPAAEDPSPPLVGPDAAIEMIRNSRLSPSAKRELIEHLSKQLDDFRQQQVREVGRLIDLAERRRRAG